MCGLFGIHYYGKGEKRFGRLLELLGNASVERGNEATGIAYVDKYGAIKVRKDSVPADEFDFTLPIGTHTVIGHTRKSSSSSTMDNKNNHPFIGKADKKFALAHNGTIKNFADLIFNYDLPDSLISTDSYVAVQMIEKQGILNHKSIRHMAERIEGDFAFTILDQDRNLYILRDRKPLSLIHFFDLELYVYASTEQILMKALIEYEPTRDIIVNKLTFTGSHTYSVRMEYTGGASGFVAIDKDGRLILSSLRTVETSKS